MYITSTEKVTSAELRHIICFPKKNWRFFDIRRIMKEKAEDRW